MDISNFKGCPFEQTLAERLVGQSQSSAFIKVLSVMGQCPIVHVPFTALYLRLINDYLCVGTQHVAIKKPLNLGAKHLLFKIDEINNDRLNILQQI